MKTAWSNDKFTQEKLREGAKLTSIETEQGLVQAYRLVQKEGNRKFSETLYEAEHVGTIPADPQDSASEPTALYELKMLYTQSATFGHQVNPENGQRQAVSFTTRSANGPKHLTDAITKAIGWNFAPETVNSKPVTQNRAGQQIKLDQLAA